MIKNLVASILISLNIGAAKPNNFVAPKKNASNVNEYSFTLTGANRQTTTYQNAFNPTSQVFSNDVEYKDQLTYNSGYLNVIGNIYQTLNQRTINSSWGTYTQDLSRVENNYDNIDPEASRFSYVLQITPYNINIDTTATINIEMVYPNYRDNYGDGYNIHRIAYIRTIYTSTESTWANYVDRQSQRQQTYNIVQDIKNVDNGFYYTEYQTLKTVQYGASNVVITETDQIEIGITPDRTNYIVIDYVPVLDAVYYDYGTNTEGERVTNKLIWTEGNTAPSTINITGTNIVPTGTYEVIDVPGLMFEILGMPFAFTSQAFNLTLFPGTPYQINIANLFLSIMAIFIFVWIIGIFIKHKG